jgi:hypothetical protein
MANKIRTNEEKVATQMATAVNDLTLDLDQVGVYLARQAEAVSFRRLNIVIDSANNEKKSGEVSIGHNYIF